MKKKTKNTIGIVGGAGPMAGTLLTKKIIAECQKTHGCMNDYDYPKLILLSYPFAEMLKPNSNLQDESRVSDQLKEALAFLIENGADYLGIACNTLHCFLENTYSDERLIHLIKETELYLLKQQFSKVLVLCSSTSREKMAHDFNSIVLPTLKEQIFIDKLIQKILSGSFSNFDSRQLKVFALTKIKQDPNIDCILLGCTELSVLFDTFSIQIPGVEIVDPLNLLSSKLCSMVFDSGILLLT